MWSEFSSNPLECSVSQPGKVSGATVALAHCLISTHQAEINLNRPLDSDDVDASAQLAHWERNQNWNFKSKPQI